MHPGIAWDTATEKYVKQVLQVKEFLCGILSIFYIYAQSNHPGISFRKYKENMYWYPD